MNSAYRSGNSIGITIDPFNNKVLLITQDTNQTYSTILYRCNLDGSGCTNRNLTNWLTFNVGNYAHPFIDVANKKLRFVAINKGMGGILSMFSMLLYID